jgi:Arc/MetJ-type ribon-helix-helix transcriptional regulator
VRTISVRLDDASEATLEHLCEALGLSQTDVVKAGLELLQHQRQSPAVLAESLALVGCFSSGEQGRDHSRRLRHKLRQQHLSQQQSQGKP